MFVITVAIALASEALPIEAPVTVVMAASAVRSVVVMLIESLVETFAPTWKVSEAASAPRIAVEGFLVGVAVGRIARLHCEFTHALQRIADRCERAVGGLRQRDAVICVADRNVHAANLCAHALRDRETGGVVGCGVDPQARRQALHRSRQ
jgi:hypothetical protein